jgi:predicted PurR-regulated permease PerM
MRLALGRAHVKPWLEQAATRLSRERWHGINAALYANLRGYFSGNLLYLLEIRFAG